MTRHTKIVATLGPASRDPSVLETLIRAGVKPGPELGQLLNAALNAVIEDNIPNEREALLAHLNLG